MMKEVEDKIENAQFIGKKLSSQNKEYVVKEADNYSYKDPVDNSVADKQVTFYCSLLNFFCIHLIKFWYCSSQGSRILFEDGSRIIYRLSGTGSSGATIRVYIESYESNPSTFTEDAQKVLKPLVEIALQLSKLKEYTGREAPTVIT